MADGMICCTMIARDEAHVITRALNSARHFADAFFLLDTGSSDQTPAVFSDWCQRNSLPGFVTCTEWTDFATARTQAMREAEKSLRLTATDYHLVLDADDEIHGEPPTCSIPDAYRVRIRHAHIVHRRTQLLRADGLWSYRCPVHEYPHRYGATIDYWPGCYVQVIGGGARSLVSQREKFARDAEVIRRYLNGSQSSQDAPRMLFYLAQSLRDSGETTEAQRAFLVRLRVEAGWSEERYVSAVEAAKLGPVSESVLLEAIQINPSRPEAYLLLAQMVQYSDPARAVALRRQAQEAKPCPDCLFLDCQALDKGFFP